jgi:hypothetical protein
VRIGRKPVPADLLAEPEQLLLAEPALEERAGVDAGGGVTLDEEQVAAVGVGRRVEKGSKPTS